MIDYKKYITIEADKRGGKPCIRGMRITVYDVLEYLASGMTEEEILQDFPELTQDDIKACIAFAANRERELTKISAWSFFSIKIYPTVWMISWMKFLPVPSMSKI